MTTPFISGEAIGFHDDWHIVLLCITVSCTLVMSHFYRSVYFLNTTSPPA